MKTVLLVTLGNRDLQLKKNAAILIEHNQWFVRNNDSEEYRINTALSDKSFLDISKEIFTEHYEAYKPCFSFPMIEKSIQYLIHNNSYPEKIIFSTSNQPKLDKQDCVYVAQIAKRYFTDKGYHCMCDFFSCSPTDFSLLVEHYLTLFKDLPPGSYISTSGGTPDMRAATYFAGLFRNFFFISINARSHEVTTDSFKGQEQLILKSIVLQMLSVYDYEGIRSLPVSDEIKNRCTHAIEQYNLVNSIESGGYRLRALKAINLLMENARVCYRQGRYADTIGRIFRIEEAVWHLLWYCYLSQNGYVDKNDNVKWDSSSGRKKKEKFSSLVESADAMKSFLKSSFSDLFEEKEDNLYFRKYPEVSIRSGKNFFWYFFKTVKAFQPFTEFFERLNKNQQGEAYKTDSLLNRVRNKSYLGHGFEGVSEQDVRSVVDDITEFLNQLNTLLQQIEDWKNESIFDNINEEIKTLLT